MKSSFTYSLSLIYTALCYPLKILSAIAAIGHYIYTQGDGLIVSIALILLSLFLHATSQAADRYIKEKRMELEYDSKGRNREMGSIKDMSKKERREVERQRILSEEVMLSSAQLKSLTKSGAKNPAKAMENLVGLENVKKDMAEMAARMEFEKKAGKSAVSGTMHMLFFGPPGTGKTTVARIMTGFLYINGYIRENRCVEIDGNFLSGLSAGESSRKTAMVIDYALGGVLFIDEAYALLGSGGVAGQEVLATIVKAMEDHRGEIVFILAGYGEEMKRVVDANPGLESRIKRFLWFGDYSDDELLEIFCKMANKKNLVITAEIAEKFREYIRKAKKEKNFGNARTVRNILDKCIDCHALNLKEGRLRKSDTYKLTGEDFPDLRQQKNYRDFN